MEDRPPGGIPPVPGPKVGPFLRRVSAALTRGLPLTSPQSPLHPIPASPTSPQSVLDGSRSTLSGSASSGVSSLSDSGFGPASSWNRPPSRGVTLDWVPGSQAWTSEREDPDPPYQPVRSSLSEPDVLGGAKPGPCRSHSAPGGAHAGQLVGLAYLPPYHLYPHPHPHTALYSLYEPGPTLPPKPTFMPQEESARPLPRKISQPVTAAPRDEQAKVAWEHAIGGD